MVRTGESVPVDGVVLEGEGSVDESVITGEPLPKSVHAGSAVTGATVNTAGWFTMRAERVGEETVLAGIIRLVDEATSSKAPIEKMADKISGVFVPAVIVVAVATFVVWMALGVLCVISLCIGLKLNFAIPLASIVFADVCLYTGGDSIVYGFHRFTDTLVGLVVALLVNVVIRPYNNRQKIINMMNEIQKMFLPLLQSRVLEHRYPDLTPLTERMTSLASELRIFEKQPVALWQHAVRVAARRQEAAYLRGCEQLLAKMCGELAALCNMDSNPAPGEKSIERLTAHGLTAPENLKDYCRCSPVDAQVMDFHIGNLLDAYDFLTAFHHV